MPQDYYCESCGLVFSTGLYARRSHYPARYLLVCRSCGTVHEYRVPFGGRRSLLLMSQSGPLRLGQRPDRPVFLDTRLHWQKCPLPAGFQGLQIDKETGQLNVRSMACSHCGGSGTLTAAWPLEEKACPACRAAKLVVAGGWVT
jgi:hypothetical protein